MTTKSLGLRATARTPALPVTPIAIPAASADRPVQSPAARCAKLRKRGTSVPKLVRLVLVTIALISP